MASSYDISSLPAPEPSGPSHPRGAGEEEISYLLATMVEFGSVTQYTAVNITTDGRAVLFRSEIDDGGAEMSPRCHFSAESCPRRQPACTNVGTQVL